MFLNNKYSKTYFCLIEKAKTQIIDGYCEVHHIIPKCLGGTNNIDNLIKLSARQHFIAHLLLTKMVDGQKKYKVYNAFSKMFCISKDNSNRYLPSSKIYEYSKKLMSDYMKNNNPAKRKDVRIKMSKNSWTKSDKANEINKRISLKKNGVKLNLTDEQKKNRSLNKMGKKNGMFNKTHSEDVKKLLAEIKAKSYKLTNVNTDEFIIIRNAINYFSNDQKKYVLFNNCKQNNRLFDNIWKIEVI
jgi:hypothetical protein